MNKINLRFVYNLWDSFSYFPHSFSRDIRDVGGRSQRGKKQNSTTSRCWLRKYSMNCERKFWDKDLKHWTFTIFFWQTSKCLREEAKMISVNWNVHHHGIKQIARVLYHNKQFFTAVFFVISNVESVCNLHLHLQHSQGNIEKIVRTVENGKIMTLVLKLENEWINLTNWNWIRLQCLTPADLKIWEKLWAWGKQQ